MWAAAVNNVQGIEVGFRVLGFYGLGFRVQDIGYALLRRFHKFPLIMSWQFSPDL